MTREGTYEETGQLSSLALGQAHPSPRTSPHSRPPVSRLPFAPLDLPACTSELFPPSPLRLLGKTQAQCPAFEGPVTWPRHLLKRDRRGSPGASRQDSCLRSCHSLSSPSSLHSPSAPWGAVSKAEAGLLPWPMAYIIHSFISRRRPVGRAARMGPGLCCTLSPTLFRLLEPQLCWQLTPHPREQHRNTPKPPSVTFVFTWFTHQEAFYQVVYFRPFCC